MAVVKTPTFDPARMRELREQAGLSRAALAALCPHVSMQAIQAYEQRRNKPDIDRALEIATALGVTVHHLTS
jgi:DNA-binding XRE family transcriptional regulator